MDPFLGHCHSHMCTGFYSASLTQFPLLALQWFWKRKPDKEWDYESPEWLAIALGEVLLFNSRWAES